MINIENRQKVALITNEQRFTYNELFEKIGQFANLFTNKGYQRVAIYSENRADWIMAFYAGWLNNCTVVPIDYLASPSDVSYILNDCQPELVFTSNTKLEDFNKAKEKTNYSFETINFDEISLPEKRNEEINLTPDDKEKTAVIIYTSGTTGSPKGVMLSYTNILANLNEVCVEVEIFREDRQVLMLLPLHHIFPLVGTMIAPFFVGSSVALSPSMQSADLLKTLKDNDVVIMVGVPRLYEFIYKGLKDKINASGAMGRTFFKLFSTFHRPKLARKIFKKVHDGFGGKLEFMIAGGAALNTEVGQLFKTLGFKILEGFGMTEAAPMITFNRPHNFRIGSPGQPLRTVEVKIKEGEIIARGPNIMQGYFNRPEETADVIKDGWLHTGDLGYLDKNNFLYITGRKKEIIVLSNGKNINPVELEQKLEHASPFVTECAVLMYNNKLFAIIVPDFAELSKAEIKDAEEYFKKELIPSINKELSQHKRIMQFRLFNGEIPRTRLGKIQRFKLEELLEKRQEQKKKVDEPTTEEYKTIKLFIEEQTNSEISPDDHLEMDIALDSLGKISLIDFIEGTFGIKMDEEKLLKFPSVAKLGDFITDNKLKHKVEQIDWSNILKDNKVSFKLPKAWFTQSLFKNFSKAFFKIYFKFKGEGIKNVPDGPCIIAPNHQSFFDGMFVASLLRSKTMRKTYFYAKKKHVNNGFLRFMANKNNIIVMDLNRDLKESIQKLAEVLKMGKKIIIFPEGTRTKTGEVGEFKKMFAILSKELNVPVVPVAISGAYDALPTGRKFPKLFTRVQVEFLPPIYPEGHSYDTLSEEVKGKIEATVEA